MTEKMQCYIKSIKKDTHSIIDSLTPTMIQIGIVLGVIVVGTFIFWLLTVCEPYISAGFQLIDMFCALVISQPFFTQYNTYMTFMIISDICMIISVYHSMTNQNVAPIDRTPLTQVLISFGVLFIIFATNAMMLFIGKEGSVTPEKFIGWSYMIIETIINMIVLVIGILVFRAYLKCENKIIPLVNGDV